MISQRNPNLKAWCAQHPAMVAAMALYVASIGRDGARLVRVGNAADYRAKLPLHRDLPRWLSYYRNHRRVFTDMASLGNQHHVLGGMAGAFERLVAELKAIPDGIEDVRHPVVEACGKRMLDLYFMFETEEKPPESLTDEIIGKPQFLAVWFFACVHTPCLLLFQTSPIRLLRQARNGDLAAVGKLLMLDRNVLLEPRVGRVVHEDPAGWETVASKLPARAPTMRPARWKVIAAATMRSVAQVMRYPLTHHAMADLYHALARDWDGAKEDLDLALLQGRSFERQVAATVQQGKALMALPPSKVDSGTVNEQVQGERIRSSRNRS